MFATTKKLRHLDRGGVFAAVAEKPLYFAIALISHRRRLETSVALCTFKQILRLRHVYFAGKSENSCERDAHPGRAVIQFVKQFIQRLFEEICA